RSTALQGYWTVYILVIGGVLEFSTFRQRPEVITTVLVTVLYACFAYKNLGAIEVTLLERRAFLTALQEYPDTGPKRDDIRLLRKQLEPTLPLAEPTGVVWFHLACDLMTVAAVWAKEWQRRKNAQQGTAPAPA